MKKLVIVGNGGFAREVEWLVERINAVSPTWELLGFIDEDLKNPKVIGNDDYVVAYQKELYAAIVIGTSATRKKIYTNYAEGVAFVEDVDTAMKLGENHPMGPLALGDLIGLDVVLAILKVMFRETVDNRYLPQPMLKKMVREEKFGRKTGEGFYRY